MSIPRYFSDCPAFPDDVPTINLSTISLNKLENADQHETKEVFDACRRAGFFLLKLDDSPKGKVLLQDAENLYDLAGETLNLPQSELDKFPYNPKISLVGYKTSGATTVDDGTKDSTELYTISQDDMLGNTDPRSNPAPIEAARAQNRDFIRHANEVGKLVLSALESQLQLTPGAVTLACPLDHPSRSILRILLTKPVGAHSQLDSDGKPVPTQRKITLGQHTDIGLMTLLFNGAGGLQMLTPGASNIDANWKYIRPQPNCVLVNLGDTLVDWTGGVLRSGLHRVVTAPGRQSEVARRSFGYFLFPKSTATMTRLTGKGIPKVEGEEDERTVDEFARERSMQIVAGKLKPESRGGVEVRVGGD